MALALENAQLVSDLIFLSIHSFIRSFIHAQFLEHLLRAGHHARC